MWRRRWAGLLLMLCLAWVVMTPFIFAQPAGPKGWAIRIIGMVQRVPPVPGSSVLLLKVEGHTLSFVRRQFLADEAHAPLDEIIADFLWRARGVAVRGPEDLLMALLQEEPGQRVLELQGVYEPDARVFHLSVVHPLDRYSLDPRCPPLPATGLVNQVSVHTAKELNRPGVVCVRVINRLSEGIGHRINFARLHRWEEEGRGREAGFREFKEVSTLPDGSVVGELLAHAVLPPGGAYDEYVPRFQSAPPGRYRVCVSYNFPSWQRQSQEVCSEEFTLP
jgi:hypothetical protein